MGRLAGKVAIVTGAGGGIGRSHALMLAREGAAVVVNDIDRTSGSRESNKAARVVEEIVAAGGKAVGHCGDVADWEMARDLVERALGAFGAFDIVVCNAGIARDRFIHNMTEQEWDAVIRNHLNGHFALTHHAAVLWRARFKASGLPSGGRLIYTGSEAGMYGNVGQANYSAAKGGIHALCFEAAKEFRRFGATVNCVAPRGRSSLTAHAFGPIDNGAGDFDVWDPDNVSPLIAFLASDEARNINGQTFLMYGGTFGVMQPWTLRQIASLPRRWTVNELGAALTTVFPELKAQPAEMPEMGLNLVRTDPYLE